MDFDSIGFDLDGTLWSAIPATVRAWQEVAREDGVYIPTEDDMAGVMGLNREDLMNKIYPELTEDKKIEFFFKASDRSKKYLREQGGILYENLEPALEKLSKRYKLYIVSNCEEGYIESFLDYHELNGYFADFECAGMKSLTKGELIGNVLKRNGFKFSIYVGDTVGDFNAAADAGLDFIFAKYGFGSVENVKYELNKFDDLPELIENIKTEEKK